MKAWLRKIWQRLFYRPVIIQFTTPPADGQPIIVQYCSDSSTVVRRIEQ